MKPLGPIPSGFSAIDGELAIAGYKATALVERAGGTPLFVYSRELLTQRVAALRAAMPARLALHYAVKANPFGPVLQHMAGLVDGFDIASGGELAIVQACLYLATAPKSNAAYTAQKAAWKSARETGSLAPPANILNAPTKLMKDIGYGAGYAYDHDTADGFSGADYWPEGMTPQAYYQPVERGFEREVVKRMEWWEKKRREAR